jgi:cytochrome b
MSALKDAGFIDWTRGWGNIHASRANRYTFNIEAIKAAEYTQEDIEEGAPHAPSENLLGAL